MTTKSALNPTLTHWSEPKKNVEVGQPWALSTHQFRRTLAFYCIKNRLGTLVALKQQFKHLYLAMTEWYTNGGKLASSRLKGGQCRERCTE